MVQLGRSLFSSVTAFHGDSYLNDHGISADMVHYFNQSVQLARMHKALAGLSRGYTNGL